MVLITFPPASFPGINLAFLIAFRAAPSQPCPIPLIILIFFAFPYTSTTNCTITRPCTLRSLARSGYLIFKLDNPPIKIGGSLASIASIDFIAVAESADWLLVKCICSGYGC